MERRAAARGLTAPGWWLPAAIVVLPLLVWLARFVAAGWVPQGDTAVAAIRTRDVFSSHPPLLGMPSTASFDVKGLDLHHLGPIQFWLLAVPYAVSGWRAWGLLVGGLLLIGALCLVAVAAGWRAGGALGGWAVAAALLWVLAGTRGSVLEPWNPWPSTVGMVTLIAVGWAIWSGGRGWWPAFAVVFSIVAQGQLAVTPLAMVVAGCVLGRSLWRWRRGKPGVGRREALAAAGLLVLCWLGPIVNNVISTSGNIDAFWRYATSGELGDGPSVALVSSSTWKPLVLLLILAGAGAAVWLRALDLRRGLRGAAAPALGLATAAALTMWVSVSIGGPGRAAYVSYARGVVGLLVVLLALCAAEALARRRLRRRVAVAAAALGLVAVAAFASLGTADTADELDNSLVARRAVVAVAPVVSRHDDGQPVVVQGYGLWGWLSVAPAVQARLVAEGRDVRYDLVTGRESDYGHSVGRVARRRHLEVVVRDTAPKRAVMRPVSGATVLWRRTFTADPVSASRFEVLLLQVNPR